MKNVKLYFAPLEGNGGFVYRNAQAKVFANADRYYAPFISPNTKKHIRSREKKDIDPMNNDGIVLIPQILTNQADLFLSTAKELQELGYDEVNLNLGCPSKTVTPRYRGAGFLQKPEDLCMFLDEICEKSPIAISIKTRIGMDEAEEWDRLLEIYKQFPFTEIIVHPRLGSQMYRGQVDLDAFEKSVYALEHRCLPNEGYVQNMPVYNGDLNTVADVEMLLDRFPMIDAIMLGRGVLRNPGLFGEIRGEETMSVEQFFSFEEALLEGYTKELSGDHTVLFKVKELWSYMANVFALTDKEKKAIKKTKTITDYQRTVRTILLNKQV